MLDSMVVVWFCRTGYQFVRAFRTARGIVGSKSLDSLIYDDFDDLAANSVDAAIIADQNFPKFRVRLFGPIGRAGIGIRLPKRSTTC
jgi:hypothetical protein